MPGPGNTALHDLLGEDVRETPPPKPPAGPHTPARVIAHRLVRSMLGTFGLYLLGYVAYLAARWSHLMYLAGSIVLFLLMSTVLFGLIALSQYLRSQDAQHWLRGRIVGFRLPWQLECVCLGLAFEVFAWRPLAYADPAFRAVFMVVGWAVSAFAFGAFCLWALSRQPRGTPGLVLVRPRGRFVLLATLVVLSGYGLAVLNRQPVPRPHTVTVPRPVVTPVVTVTPSTDPTSPAPKASPPVNPSETQVSTPVVIDASGILAATGVGVGLWLYYHFRKWRLRRKKSLGK